MLTQFLLGIYYNTSCIVISINFNKLKKHKTCYDLGHYNI